MDKFIEKSEYTKQDIVYLLKIKDRLELDNLYKLGNEIKKTNIGEDFQLRPVLQFSNFCRRNCLYCKKRKSNDKLTRYQIEPDKIIEYAQLVNEAGFDRITLHSGENPDYTIEILDEVVQNIKKTTDLNILLRIGERPETEYHKFKSRGINKVILKHETSDPVLYRSLHPDCKYSNRIKSLRLLKSIGFNVGSGIMLGLPGQTLESIANDILLFKMLDIDIAEIEPYIPHKDTPLGKRFAQMGGYFTPALGYFHIDELKRKVIATTRIVTKTVDIPTHISYSDRNNISSIINPVFNGANIISFDIIDSNTSEQKLNNPNKKELLKQLTKLNKDLSSIVPVK